jgi:acyl-CoA synthetase (AMP-forming)/AMP-acid ligase II/thioesterase domain-containing protein/acyl carrier protein
MEAIPSQDPKTLHDVVANLASRDCGMLAILEPDRAPLSAAALARQVDAVQAVLGNAGLLGVAVGATAVPLNPAGSADEFRNTFSRLAIDALISPAGPATAARGVAAEMGLGLIDLEAMPNESAGSFRLRVAKRCLRADGARADHADACLLLLTSGTTAAPKIVPVTQASLIAKAANSVRAFDLGPRDRCLNVMPYFHGHGIYDGLVAPLLAGGSAICLGDFTVERFFAALTDLRPTWYTAAFTFHHAIADAAPRFSDHVAGHRLRFARSGSGALDADVLDRVETIFGVPVVVTYAMTEAGIVSATPLQRERRRSGTVGCPPPDTLAIVDENGEMLPAGATGEVVVRGPHVIVADQVGPDGAGAATAGGWLRTGDQGRLDEDGALTLTGRLKEIINRGGEKIAPAEVDAVLRGHPDVADALTFAMPHRSLGEEVAAAVVWRRGAEATSDELKSFARERLAGFKAPKTIVAIDTLPTGPTGKPQRIGLASRLGLDGGVPAPTDRDPLPGPPPTAPETELARIWAEELGLESVGLDDDYFSLGGDSLQAVRIFVRAEGAFGRRLPISTLFEAATVRQMARRFTADANARSLVPIVTGGERTPIFCVHGGGGGNVLVFRFLATELGADQPVYGLQAKGLADTETPLIRIEDMAAHYINEIKTVQPLGPYIVGGFSFGGLVAHEMAVQLSGQGDDVALLVLFDSYSSTNEITLSPGSWWQRNRNRIRNLKLKHMIAFVGERLRSIGRHLLVRVQIDIYRLLYRRRENQSRTFPAWMLKPRTGIVIARQDYRLKEFAGSAVLFRAADNTKAPGGAFDDWPRYVTGGLDTLFVPGAHWDILRPPHIAEVARALRPYLDQCQAASVLETAPPPAGTPPSVR